MKSTQDGKTFSFKELEGIRTEITAGKVLVPLTAEDRTWNAANDRAINIINKYLRGEGLFQLPTPSDNEINARR